jgi:hypothetical protein
MASSIPTRSRSWRASPACRRRPTSRAGSRRRGQWHAPSSGR